MSRMCNTSKLISSLYIIRQDWSGVSNYFTTNINFN